MVLSYDATLVKQSGSPSCCLAEAALERDQFNQLSCRADYSHAVFRDLRPG